MLKIENLTYRIAGRLLFDGVNAVIDSGHKVGFVGRNGTGKTTLFGLITGTLDLDGGTITVPPHWRVGITSQEAPGGEASLIDTVIGADTELTALWKETETATDATRISEIHDRLAHRQAYSAHARAARVLAGLGFDEAAQQRSCASFSGGWRMRVALASLLFTEPDLLLLDEPTNHLDLEATLWLEDYIAGYQGTVLIISHDRDLLNRAVGEILHLDRTKVTHYQGNYDRFEAHRRMQLELDGKMRAKQAAQRDHMEKFVNRFRAKASKAKQAQSRLKMLARLPPPIALSGERIPSFHFPEVPALAPPLFSLDRVIVGYGDTPVLRDLSLRLDDDDRIALLGANGNGKTTFIKLLAGMLKPMTGHMVKSSKLRVGYFSQQLTEQLDPSSTAVQSLARLRPDDTPEMCRTYLGRFGFSDELALGRIGSLSGGERARLVFAQIAATKPHVLLLDEPTNHLDMISRDALVQAINEFAGAVVIVSHDPHLIELTVDRFWLVSGGRVLPFEGDMADYRALTLKRGRSSQGEAEAGLSEPRAANANKKEKRRLAAEKRRDSTDVGKNVKKSEELFDRLTKEKKKLLEKLSNPALYLEKPEEAKQLQQLMAGLQRDLDAAEAAWVAGLEAQENTVAARMG
ncbi:MAG: ABC-F family ATP-binding cassette domain-containing protein [Proteobacteria bacterium]|nr:ABC-F family ATP-binding cassette domain-containing protein [Pseudomonadota bacterium]